MLIINFSNRQRKFSISAKHKDLITSAVTASLETEGISDPAEVNVTFVSDEGIRKINRDFRNVNCSTDVLSFPLGENGVYDVSPENGCLLLGDVIISVEHAEAQAELYGHGFERELAYLTVHSVFHLLGYDHLDEAEEKKRMRAKEEAALSLIGLQII